MSKKLIMGILIAFVILVVGGYIAYTKFGVLADVVGVDGSTIGCSAKLSGGLVTTIAGKDALMISQKTIRTSEAGPFTGYNATYLLSGKKIYVTDGQVYPTIAAVKASSPNWIGIKYFSLAGAYYRASSNHTTDMSDSEGGTGPFYTRTSPMSDGLAYAKSKNSDILLGANPRGAVINRDGKTEVCLSSGKAYEYDAEKSISQVLTGSVIAFDLKASADKTEAIYYVSDEGYVNINAHSLPVTVTLADDWTYGMAKLTTLPQLSLSNSTEVIAPGVKSFTITEASVPSSGIITATLTYKDSDGALYQRTMTFDIGLG